MTNSRDICAQAWRLFDRYVQGEVSRRAFPEPAATIAGGPAGAGALLAARSPNFAAAQQIKPDFERLVTRHQIFPSPDGSGEVKGYLARPAGSSARPLAMLVIRGLQADAEDVGNKKAGAGPAL